MIVAFFDFDGTITQKDSFLDFIYFTKGKKAFFKGLLLHFFSLAGYKLSLVSGKAVKENLLTYFFKNTSIDDFKKMGIKYTENRLPVILNPKALAKIEWHKKQGHEIVIVTASINYWIQEWSNSLELSLISTQLEIKNNILTGKLLGANCNGIEKVNRVMLAYNVQKLEDS